MNPASPLPGGGGGHSNPANVAVPPADRPLPRRLGRKSGRTRFSQEALVSCLSSSMQNSLPFRTAKRPSILGKV